MSVRIIGSQEVKIGEKNIDIKAFEFSLKSIKLLIYYSRNAIELNI